MKKQLFKLNFRGKKFIIKNYIECRSFFSKLRGLMFRPRNFKTPLVFIFPFPRRYRIHSFFCRKFLAIWMLKGRIVDARIVKPWRIAVTSKEKFDELLEIPVTSSR